jgi:hypothetical protein
MSSRVVLANDVLPRATLFYFELILGLIIILKI